MWKLFPHGRLLATGPSHHQHQPSPASRPRTATRASNGTPGNWGLPALNLSLHSKEQSSFPKLQDMGGLSGLLQHRSSPGRGWDLRGLLRWGGGCTKPDPSLPSLIHAEAQQLPELPHPAVYFCPFLRNFISDVWEQPSKHYFPLQSCFAMPYCVSFSNQITISFSAFVLIPRPWTPRHDTGSVQLPCLIPGHISQHPWHDMPGSWQTPSLPFPHLLGKWLPPWKHPVSHWVPLALVIQSCVICSCRRALPFSPPLHATRQMAGRY